MNLLLAIFFIVTESVLEAVFNKFNPAINKFIRKYHVLVVLLFFIPFAAWAWFNPNDTPYWKLFLGFWFMRFMIYDTTWNLTTILCGTHIPIWYYGTTKLYDRIMTRLGSWGWFMKLVCGIVGICFLLGWS
jgi:hypothetical protein